MFALRSCGKRLVTSESWHALRSVAAAPQHRQALAHRQAPAPSQIHLATTTSPALSRWYATDKTPLGDQQRIYYGSLAPRMRAVKILSLTTSIVGLAAQPVLVEQGMKLGGTGMAVALCTIGGFFTFVTPLLLHFVTKKYVTEMHYNPATDEYTATTISLLLRKVKTTFRPSDVKVPDVPGMFTSFTIGQKPLFVDPALFEDPEHYVRIMGYDKPVDFKLELTEKPAKPTDTDTKN